MATLIANSTTSNNGFNMANIPYFIGDFASSWLSTSNIHISNFIHQQDYYGTFNFDKNGNVSGNLISTYYHGFNSDFPDYSITDTSIDAKTAFGFIDRREINSLFSMLLYSDDFIGGTINSDNLIGFNGNDTLVGQIGDDILNGGEGSDTAQFSGISAQTTLTRIPVGWSASGPDGMDTLINIENIKFDNETVTPQFDALQYTASYPDLIIAFSTNEIKAEAHYLQMGFYEGRVATFDALSYIASYPDLIAAFGTDERAAEAHYIQNGFYEGRFATFNASQYIASYPDLETAYGTNEKAALMHYIQYGFYEDRQPAFAEANLIGISSLIDSENIQTF